MTSNRKLSCVERSLREQFEYGRKQIRDAATKLAKHTGLLPSIPLWHNASADRVSATYELRTSTKWTAHRVDLVWTPEDGVWISNGDDDAKRLSKIL